MTHNDPHVDSLEYKFTSDSTRVFNDPPPLEHQASAFNLRLADDHLTVEMKEHCATEHEARALVDPFVLAWEIDQALQSGAPRAIRFRFLQSNVSDRQPPPPGSPALLTGTASMTMTVNNPNLVVTAIKYPPPPEGFKASADVATLWHRYEGHLLGREPLPGMAFFCLTSVEWLYGGDRRKAAQALSISFPVLAKLGELTSTRGDEATARKREEGRPLIPLTMREERWIHVVLKQMIRRVAMTAAGARPPTVLMADLPPLS